jgi:DNA-binding winged helix-turn-helix (wHTH) protein
MRLVFGDCVLDLDRRELSRGGRVVPTGPQVFDLLVYLVANRERVVTRDDLLASVWSGRIVSDSTLASHINAVRKASVTPVRNSGCSGRSPERDFDSSAT